jgi:Sulfotransferase domain
MMPQPRRIPDFFIVGAPKCGTTALYSYLQTHPGVFMSPVKEPHYFYSDNRTSTVPGGRIGGFARPEYYSQLFAAASENQLCGEGTTLYLFSRFAVAEILKANPNAKLIAMVRNPLEMVVSYHRQNLYDFVDDEPDFAIAWKLSEARADGLNLPPGCTAPEKLHYKSMGRLGEQVARLVRTANPEQVHIIVFDDFISDTPATYRRTLQFLELPEAGTTEFQVVNAHKEHQLPWLSRWMVHTPGPLVPLKTYLKRRFPIQLKRAAHSIRNATSRPAAKPKIAAELRREMAAEFADDIKLLGSLLHRDLSHWYKSAL